MISSKGRLKRVQHLYPTFSCHVGRNRTEPWMIISELRKGSKSLQCSSDFM